MSINAAVYTALAAQLAAPAGPEPRQKPRPQVRRPGYKEPIRAAVGARLPRRFGRQLSAAELDALQEALLTERDASPEYVALCVRRAGWTVTG